MFTCGDHIWCSHVVFTYDAHMWCSPLESTYGLPQVIYCIWCSHMMFTCGTHIWCSYVKRTYDVHMLSSYMMFTYGVHIWSSHVIYDMYGMWFTVYDLPYMEFTCGFLWNHIQTSKSYTVNHMWFSAYDFRIWFPYMISVYGVHMLFSSMIIYGSVYDHIRKPHVEYLFACGVHMWTFPHMSPHVDLFSLVM